MSKVIKYYEDATKSVIEGIDTVANIVKTTAGPKGRNVLIRNNLDIPIITNDGVTIAKNIMLKDNAQDAGASLVISAANKTNNIAGDGTTTTTILTQALIKEFKNVCSNSNIDINTINVIEIQKQMVKASSEINDYLLSIAKPVKDIQGIKEVASISSGSEETGDIIAKAFEQCGDYGSVVVEDSRTGKDFVETVQGMKFETGMVTPYLLTDRANMKTEVTDAKLLVTTESIQNATDLFPVLDMCLRNKLKLVILCDDISSEALNMVVVNKMQGAALDVSIVRLPGFGKLREDLTSDICLATGATLISRESGKNITNIDIKDLGEAKEVKITQDSTIIKFKDTSCFGVDLLKVRQLRCEELKSQLANAQESEKEQYKRRISNLISGISVIKVNGNSEVEIKDKKLRIEDAINSVESAREEGIVPGGGYSFLMAILNKGSQEVKLNLGEQIVYNSLKYVTKQIATNAGYDGDEVVNKCLQDNLGFNAVTCNYENLLDTGVINSVKTDRYSLLNSVSVASTVITMGGMIIEENEKDTNVLQIQGTVPGIM